MPTMWDRLKAAPLKPGGGPFDDPRGSLAHKHNNGYSYSIKGGPPPPRPPREFYDSQFETAPAVQEPPPRNPNRLAAYRDSTLRPASSVYSEPSPTNPQFPATVASRQPPQYGYGGAPPGDEISPPSSPEPDYRPKQHRTHIRRPSSPEVSPIEEEAPDMSQHFGASRGPGNATMNQQTGDSPQSRTNIPQMRRARRKQSDAALREAHSRERMNHPTDSKNQVLWDPMTGERTNTERGRPSQVNPAEYAQGLGVSDVTNLPSQQKSPTVTTMFGERVRRLAQAARPNKPDNTTGDPSTDPAAGAFSSGRPGWRGASGRTTIVDPVRDNPGVAPLKIPQKSNKRVISPTSATAPRSGGLTGGFFRKGQTPPVSPRGPETPTGAGSRETIRKVVPSSQLSPSATKAPEAGRSYPSPPLSGSYTDPDAPAVAAKQLQSDLAASSPTASTFNTSHPVEKTPIRRKPPPSNLQDQRESVSSVYSQQSSAPPPPPPHNPNAGYLASNEPWSQPPSRFSATTYATSSGETPRESLDNFDNNQPAVPETPERFRESPKPKGESVMDRKRPVGHRDASPSNPIIISMNDSYMSSPYGHSASQAARDRKAAAAGASGNPIRARTTVERPVSSASSINKSLPTPPPETTASAARDRVGLLNAQLQALGNRRINLTRSIKQMTELMPTDNLMASDEVVRKREMEKRKVEALRIELADVQREEYELGLKLHRAYKRLDRDAEWEPTALWVRRVTG